MSNILIADGNGRRRVQVEVLAQGHGHHTYSVGTLAEALRYAQVYVPEIMILAEGLPDGNLSAVISAFRSSERMLLRELSIVTATSPQSPDPHVTVARNNTATALVEEAQSALSRVGVVV